MSAMNGGELIARCLANEGVKFLIGLPCPDVDPLLAKLDEFGIRLVPVRHEAAAVHIAEGIYKTTGTVAAVFGNPGPGFLQSAAGRAHRAARRRAGAGDHRAAPPRHRQPFVTRDVPGTGSVERLPPRRQMGRPGRRMGAHSRAVPDGVSRNVERPSRTRSSRHPQHGRLRRWRPGEGADLSGIDGTREPAAGIAAADPRGGGPARRGEASGHHLRQSASIAPRRARWCVNIAEMLNCPVITTMAGRSSFPIDHPNHLPMYLVRSGQGRGRCRPRGRLALRQPRPAVRQILG